MAIVIDIDSQAMLLCECVLIDGENRLGFVCIDEWRREDVAVGWYKEEKPSRSLAGELLSTTEEDDYAGKPQ